MKNKHLENAMAALSTLSVCGDAVDIVFVVRQQIRQADEDFWPQEAEKKEEAEENG